ncbi:capsular polysaccharide synthesis protein [Streptococcus suis]|uniref:capsular polysaccharide synthesis protein n=1 Tax=Streptococcus suis TaxID=1307 RepID=UPI001ABDDEDB|nr:capsular polysaccharide synthesis protein [Streptococcus suis]
MISTRIFKIIENYYKIVKKIGYQPFINSGQFLYEYKNKKILEFIEKNIDVQFLYNQILSNNLEVTSSDTIWISWLQGEDSAPYIVKKCIKSVREQANGRNLIIITEANFQEFVELPLEIIRKYKQGSISRTHFSDCIRLNLLSQKGGLWIDATIFLTKDVVDEFTGVEFLSIHSDNLPLHPISKGLWSTFFMYSPRNYPLLQLAASIFNQYFIQYNQIIDYFLLDYVLLLAVRMTGMEEILRNKKINGNERFYLFGKLNDVMSDEIKDKINASYGVHKLTYKKKYTNFKNNHETVYHYYLGKEEMET